MMKTFKQSLLTALLLQCSTAVGAYDFELDGIYYNILLSEEKIVEVTHSDNKYSGTVIIPSSVIYNGVIYCVTSVREYAFNSCSSLESITIPDGVTNIGECAFSNCSSLKSISIPESVKDIGEYAFSYCSNLTSITIPKGVTRIEEGMFRFCSSLESISMPESVKDIGEEAFYYCSSLESITLPECITSIRKNAFKGSRLVSITIPSSLTSVGSYAFSGCSYLESVTIGNGIASLEHHAFSNCSSLKSISMPESVKDIGEDAFYYCSSLESITIPQSVRVIRSRAFYKCSSLKNIVIPERVTGIAMATFADCSSLTSITIPNSVTSIGNSAFSGCSSLESISSLIPAENLFAVNSNAFEGVDKSACTLYVPAGAKDTYAATEGWSEFANIEELQYSLTVGSAGYATLYLDYPVRRPDRVKVYYINEVDGDYAMLEPIWDYIPAKTGVIIQAKQGVYDFVYTTEEVDEVVNNMLCGTAVDKEISVAANTEYYALGIKNGAVGFYRATTPGGIYFNNANKAYLPLTEAQESAHFTFIFPDGTTTDVNEMFGAEGEEVIYDIYGNRIEEITEHGVYIINGKKVIR